MGAIENIANFLRSKEANQFIISSHINPDGDAIASSLAFGSLLQKLQKDYRIVFDGFLSDRFEFLPGFEAILHINDSKPGEFKADHIVIVDASNMNRLGEITKIARQVDQIICIDHHIGAEHFGNLSLIDTGAAASTQLIYDLISSLNVPFDARLASQIYTGIVAETGRFRFSNTSSKVLQICAEMVNYGADPSFISENIYYQSAYESMKLLGVALNAMERHYDGKVIVIPLDYTILSQEIYKDADDDGIVDYTVSVRGVEVGIFLRESRPQEIRVSLRAKSDFDVQKVAGRFGGGGHKKAAGCRLKGSIEEIKRLMLEEVGRNL
ncbi:MAG: bifunctional oligoribonuclease/PAP phosphatase NrnA [Candidatus Tectomicrobia bacterium]|nr:bifunctional oligoribonuclease/PAP phosphatase NrnA [Candidatus Tectomicrobia bacterium]